MVFTVYNNEKNNGIASIHNDDKKPFLPLRWTVVLVEAFGYFIIFFIRNSFAVTLVAMVNSTESSIDPKYTEDMCPAALNNTLDPEPDDGGSVGEFQWDASAQGILLGAYFWGFSISRIFVSRLAETIGQRIMVATGIGCAGVLTLLSPTAAVHGDVYALAALRFLTGFSLGPMMSSMHSLLSSWAPRSELSRMITVTFVGMTVGGTVGMFISGWLGEQLGWKTPFWIGGSLVIVFLPVWIIVVRNSPFKHPWLSTYERRLLMENRSVKNKKTVPWFKIVTSPYLFICSFSQFARIWLDTILATEGPSFFNYKIGLDLSTASYVLGGTYFSALFFMLAFGTISDCIINRKYVSKVNARRIFHFIASQVSSIFLIGICLADCNTALIITFWVLTDGFACATPCSYMASVIDLAPNYTATFMGLMGVANFAGAITPIVTSALLNMENGWNKSFYLATGLNVFSGILYIVFITAEAQPWNFEDSEKEEEKNNK